MIGIKSVNRRNHSSTEFVLFGRKKRVRRKVNAKRIEGEVAQQHKQFTIRKQTTRTE